MSSLEVLEFEMSIKNYIKQQNMPKEVIRLILADVLREVTNEAIAEATKQAEEKEKENGNTNQDEV